MQIDRDKPQPIRPTDRQTDRDRQANQDKPDNKQTNKGIDLKTTFTFKNVKEKRSLSKP